ncbi:hypothetical protein W02_36250 [Nitrospira sp. KM1]|uniref:OmpA family protein n=1 Tax=Nitrospira sp. KM1 TaxID=1936990 RepID=UPI0013A7764A|nr:OmpA family protein [Nitrospira sp. KM1]BCA56485.1 hypothetical protein W02_36250 [Nitrospira sp. KM1]
MRRHWTIVSLGGLAACLLIQACAGQSASTSGDEYMAGTERIDEQAIKHIPPPGFGTTTSQTKPHSMRAELSARNATGLPAGSLNDVLFDFDQATLRHEALPGLEANAKRLEQDGVDYLLLEGRGDEVGTAAYNMVLGEKRAQSVKSYLKDLGLTMRFKTTSYGKDRPLCFKHDEDCMQKNRSVHFVVRD